MVTSTRMTRLARDNPTLTIWTVFSGFGAFVSALVKLVL